MKRIWKDQRGMTLLELLVAVAILSVVSIASVSLLLFCIRTNSFIITGSSSSVRSDQLNARLATYFSAAHAIKIEQIGENEGLILIDCFVEESDEEPSVSFQLRWDASEETLSFSAGEENWVVIGEKITDFEPTLLPEAEDFEMEVKQNLLRLQYTVSGSYTCTKIFRIGK